MKYATLAFFGWLFFMAFLVGCDDKEKDQLKQANAALIAERNALNQKVESIQTEIRIEGTPQAELVKQHAAQITAAHAQFDAERAALTAQINDMRGQLSGSESRGVRPEIADLQTFILACIANFQKIDARLSAIEADYAKIKLDHSWSKGNCNCSK